MNFWSAVIYGFAAVVAIQGLLALMTAHRKAALRRYLEEESRRHAEEEAQAAAEERTKAA